MTQEVKEYSFVHDDASGIALLEREIRIPNKVIERILTKTIRNKLEFLENQIEILKREKEPVLNNEEAKQLIVKTLENFKANGIREVDIIDLHAKTSLPLQQISGIMHKLEKEGKVKENGQNN